jgi:DeoR family suf operon transcriptional repressor
MTNGASISLAGHRGLRGQVLLEIKKSQPITAKELAGRFGVSANAVRRHLKELESEGLVMFGREQRSMGAPAFAYRLSEQGTALFPNGYQDALMALLEQIAEQGGREAVAALFESRYERLAERLKVELAAAPTARRLAVLARALTEAGYMAEWRESDGTFHLEEHNCAMRGVVERWPEICAAEERFLREVLGAEVKRETHMVTGCNSCEYAINFAGECGPQREQV